MTGVYRVNVSIYIVVQSYNQSIGCLGYIVATAALNCGSILQSKYILVRLDRINISIYVVVHSFDKTLSLFAGAYKLKVSTYIVVHPCD